MLSGLRDLNRHISHWNFLTTTNNRATSSNILKEHTLRWSQFAKLSPVQMAPYRWLPAKKARESTKGRVPDRATYQTTTKSTVR